MNIVTENMKKFISLIALFASLNIYPNPTSQWYQEDSWSGGGIWPLLVIPVFGFLAILVWTTISDLIRNPKDVDWQPLIIFLILVGPVIVVGFLVL